MYKKSVFWYRRDLRIEDNAGMYHALKNSEVVIPIFIFDKNILDLLEDKSDARVQFIYDTITDLKNSLNDLDSELYVYYGNPVDLWPQILEEHNPEAIFLNRDYESYAINRDNKIRILAADQGISFHDFKDHVIFEYQELLKKDGSPYVVFTPFKKKWLEKLNSKGLGRNSYYFKSYSVDKYMGAFAQNLKQDLISLEDMGFQKSSIQIPSKTVMQKVIKEYDRNRNFPGIEGTSKLGIHFRFGTISIREKARKAHVLNEVFLSELVWRDFYSGILSAFPHVQDSSFRPKYDAIEWRNNEKEFKAWCEGKTGYPIVDAGMRELNATGFMHNRVRMITASFLTKHLLIDWRWGEAYFASKLLDFDLASNNGGWQWAAGCGTDAAPYFRIFNPYTQREKFDKQWDYVRKWVPEFDSEDYVSPIVNHKEARVRCLSTYKEALEN